MKRNMDLIRAMLLAIEEIPTGNYFESSTFQFEDIHARDIIGHMQLLDDAGLIAGFQEFWDHATCDRLTWSGQEFLAEARSETIWNKAKAELQSKGIGFSLEVLKATLIHIAKKQLGLEA